MRLEHWTSAAEQGATAVRNALDPAAAAPFSTVPYFWFDWYTDKLQMVGITDADRIQVFGDLDTGRWVALYRSRPDRGGALAEPAREDHEVPSDDRPPHELARRRGLRRILNTTPASPTVRTACFAWKQSRCAGPEVETAPSR